jgi:dual-specificity kinase
VLAPNHDDVNWQFHDLVKKLLAFDPALRMTVKDALQHPYFSLNIAGPAVDP